MYLVRHGETEDNKNHIMQGQVQGKLDEVGFEQARQVSRQMAHEPIDAFVSSDLHRAVQTCEIIAEPHGKRWSKRRCCARETGVASRVSIYPT